ncbi:MAG: primosomal protein N' [Holophagaceae bacterium]|nr:primosomal protein N' [Holophagaceae bacterium]
MPLVPTRIELARPLPPLTYLAPEGIPSGVRVRVKLRNGAAMGVVLGADPRPPSVKLKPIESVVDPFPLLPPKLRDLLAFAAEYYAVSIAHLMPLCLPIALIPDWEIELENGERLADLRDAGRWAELAAHGEAWHRGEETLRGLLHSRGRRGAGLTEVRRTALPHPLKVTPTQAKALVDLEAAGGTMLESELRERTGASAAILAALEAKGLIQRTRRLDLLSRRREEGIDQRVTLNHEQWVAAEAVDRSDFGVHLLSGVTGSGKTEVYLELAERVLRQGRRVLWLVPEIGLTPGLLARLEARFPGQVALGHAELNLSEKQADVVRLLQDEAPIFVGVRNAALAPLRNIGLIVVDEEHEGSYKSEEHPRIHARDLAIKRGQIEHCPVVLGSATPSLESWQAAQQGRYKLLKLTQRPSGIDLPEVQVVDLRDAFREQRKRVVFSKPLLAGISESLARGEQAMLLLNRRGFENFWMCRSCGKPLDCPHCAVSLTYHKGPYRLRCHLCGFEAVPPEVCPHCHADHLRGVGEGTEQIEDQLQALFPKARILRLDRDTTTRKGSMEAGLLAAERGQVDILVGTQMLAKGHNFPHLTLVGILNADQGLRFPDFRAAERTFQLLTQVAGRSGRAAKPGRVVLQTYSPDHPAIAFAIRQDFEGFAGQELDYREALAYPPFTALALFRSEADSMEAAKQALEIQKARFASVPGLRLLGPLEAPVSKVRDRFRMHLLVKARQRSGISAALQAAPLLAGGPVVLDRDPINFG